LAKKNQNVSPAIQATGAGDKAIRSPATVLFPAPTGPERMTIGFIFIL
jgi:hypothetical protein